MKKVSIVAITSLFLVLTVFETAAPAQQRKAQKAQTSQDASLSRQDSAKVNPAQVATDAAPPASSQTQSPQPQRTEWWKTGADKVVGFIPDFFAGLLILVVGLCIAVAVQSIAWRLLPRTGFDEFLHRKGILGEEAKVDRATSTDASQATDDYPFADREPKFYAASEACSRVLFWVVVLLTSVQVARSWHMESVAYGLGRVAGYLPHLFAAIAIFITTIIVSDWIADRVASGQGFASNSLVRGGVRGVVLTIGGFLSLRELQIAPDIVKIAFTLVLGSIAVAVALAFGLGARGVAEQVTSDAYQNARTSSRSGAAFNKAA